MRLFNDPASRCARLILTLMMGLVWSTRPWLAQADDVPAGAAAQQTPAQLADTLERTLQLYARLDRSIPRDRFDPAAVLKVTGVKPDKIVAWMKQNVRYVPYRGALRGILGVLSDRGANSLDQSLLLARLLQLAGCKVRLAHGQLTDAQAGQLLGKYWDAAPLPPASDAPPELSDNLPIDDLASKCHIPAAQLQGDVERGKLNYESQAEDFVRAVSEASDRLSSLVRAPKPDAAVVRAAAKADAVDHWWVQCEVDQKWQDYDLFAGDGQRGAHLVDAVETIDWKAEADKLPLTDAQCQTIELRVVFEQWKSGVSTRQTSLKYTLRPADWDGTAATLSIVPPAEPKLPDTGGGIAGVKTEIRSQLLKQRQWVPVLHVGTQTIVQSGFDDRGNLIAEPTNGTGNAVAGAVGQAGSAFDTSPPPAEAPGTLTGAWIEFQFIAPGAKPVIEQRTLFDLCGPAARLGGNLSAPAIDEKARIRRAFGLYQSIDLLPIGSTCSSELALHMNLAHSLEAGQPILKALRSAGTAPTPEMYNAIFRAGTFPQALYALAAQRNSMDFGVAVDRPNLFALHHLLVPTQKGDFLAAQAIDIVANPVVARPGGAGDSFAACLKQGVLETQLESRALGSDAALHNTAALFAASVNQKIDWIALSGADDGGLAKLKLGPNSMARIVAALKAGYVVVAPRQPVVTRGLWRTGWWRVDPASGNCIGIMSDGMGTEIAEEGATNTIAWKAAGFGIDLVKSAIECNGFAALGCIICHVLIAVALCFTPGKGGLADMIAEITMGHAMGMACPEGGGESGGGEGGGGGENGGPQGGQNFTPPEPNQSTDPGMSSEGGGGNGE